MGDLFFLRALLRSNERSGPPDDINRAFRRANFESAPGRAITRASLSFSPVATALGLIISGIKSVNACTRSSSNVNKYSMWYSGSLRKLLRVEITGATFAPFRASIDRIYALAGQTRLEMPKRDRPVGAAFPTRPTSLIKRGVKSRISGSPAGAFPNVVLNQLRHQSKLGVRNT